MYVCVFVQVWRQECFNETHICACFLVGVVFGVCCLLFVSLIILFVFFNLLSRRRDFNDLLQLILVHWNLGKRSWEVKWSFKSWKCFEGRSVVNVVDYMCSTDIPVPYISLFNIFWVDRWKQANKKTWYEGENSVSHTHVYTNTDTRIHAHAHIHPPTLGKKPSLLSCPFPDELGFVIAWYADGTNGTANETEEGEWIDVLGRNRGR